jgi:hypothetical protein
MPYGLRMALRRERADKGPEKPRARTATAPRGGFV